MSEDEWKDLIDKIKSDSHECTPFLGAGTGAKVGRKNNIDDILETANVIAKQWSVEVDYPFADKENLANVAQYISVMKNNPVVPKTKIRELIKNRLYGDKDKINEGKVAEFERKCRKFKEYCNSQSLDCKNIDSMKMILENPKYPFKKHDPFRTYCILAKLPFPFYITTNYDTFMEHALRCCDKTPIRDFCIWNKYMKGRPKKLKIGDHYKNIRKPIVFYFHGYEDDDKSIVISENDYTDFIINTINVVGDRKFIKTSDDGKHIITPSYITEKLTNTQLLFIGYSLRDINLRAIFRSLSQKYITTPSVSVQLSPQLSAEKFLKNDFKYDPTNQPDKELISKLFTSKIIKACAKNHDYIHFEDHILDMNDEKQLEKKILESYPRFFANSLKIVKDKWKQSLRVRARDYLQKALGEAKVSVNWSSSTEFLTELVERWE